MHSSGTFSRAIARAQDHGVRVIALQRRDYRGSSPFSSEELEVLKSADPAVVQQAVRKIGLEIATCLVGLVDKHQLPHSNGGGLTVVGWSMGGMMLSSFAHYFPTYPEKIQIVLNQCVRSIIYYGTCQANTSDRPCSSHQNLLKILRSQ